MGNLHFFHDQFLVPQDDFCRVALLEIALQHLLGNGVLHGGLDFAAERPRAVALVKACLGKGGESLLVPCEGDTLLFHAAGGDSQHPLGDFGDVIFGELTEHDGLVNAV